jgi:F-type H+-transporting ATPase subunit b
MDILGQLGINTTAVIQFVLFAITLIFLSKLVFGPYAHALEERQKRTKGGEDLAVEFHQKALGLQTEYEEKLRRLNGEIKNILDAARMGATKEYEAAVSGVRSEAEKLILENRKNLTQTVQVAAEELKSQTPTVAMAITNKLLK